MATFAVFSLPSRPHSMSSSALSGAAEGRGLGGFQEDGGTCPVATLGGDSVVIVQQSAQTLSLFHSAFPADVRRIRANQHVIQTLMVAFSVIVHHEFSRRPPNRAFAEQD